MNEYTISAYAWMNETDRKISYELKYSKFYTSMRDTACFEIREQWVYTPGKDTKSKAEFCPFWVSTSNETREEWDYDFNLFKNQCWNDPAFQKNVSIIIDEREMAEELEKKKWEMRIDMVRNKKKKMIEDEYEATAYTKQVKD